MRYAREGRHAEFEALVSARQHRSKRGIVVSSPLRDFWDGYWTTTVGVGNPPQYFQVVLDTGSANFWVMDRACTSGCAGHVTYNSAASSSYSRNGAPLNLTYGTGYANGFQGVDQFVLQGGSGSISLAIAGIPFGQITDVNEQNTAVSGILGLGFQSIAINNMLSPVMWAMSAGVFQQGLFTAHLATKGATGAGGVIGGQVTFGGLDTQNCGPVIGYAPLTAQSYWQFSLDRVGVGSRFYSANASVAISDTGTSLIAGPSAVVEQIASAVGATWNSSMGAYTVWCNAAYAPVNFVINGVTYPVSYKALTIGYSSAGTGKCMFGMSPIGGGSDIQWIVGDSFIRQYCTVYDVANKRLGFAKANGM